MFLKFKIEGIKVRNKKSSKKTYVCFMSHESLLPKKLLVEVKERNPEKLDIPVDCIAFQFFDVIGREDKKITKKKLENILTG